LRHVGRYYVTLLLNRELVSRAKLCLVSVFPDIVKDCPEIRNLPKFFLRSFQNVAVGFIFTQGTKNHSDCWRSTEVTRGTRSGSAGNLHLDTQVGVFIGRLALQMPTKHTQLTNVFSSNAWRTMTY